MRGKLTYTYSIHVPVIAPCTCTCTCMSCVPIIRYISIVHSNDMAFLRREKIIILSFGPWISSFLWTCLYNACIWAHCSFCESWSSKLHVHVRDTRDSDEHSAQRNPVPMFWQIVQSGVLHADSSKAITEHEWTVDWDPLQLVSRSIIFPPPITPPTSAREKFVWPVRLRSIVVWLIKMQS